MASMSNPLYQRSRVETLAEQFGRGQATADEVVAALQLTGFRKAGSLDELLRRTETGEDGSDDSPNGWSDVEGVYLDGGLTDAQYRQLFRTAFPDAKS